MKRILSFAASAALLFLGASCQKQEIVSAGNGIGDVMKTVSVTLGDPATRAASALSGEGAIEDATLFVWQHNAETDETTLYQKAYAEASTFEFDLLFSDQTEYTYSINAWANMGELDVEPADGEILFSNEEVTGLQMKGSKSGIDQASASAVTIDMKRYVGKITVAEVALEWTNEQNALQDFTLKSIYVADAGDKAEGAVATYNVGGAYVSSAMDALLYSPVNSVIADGAKYETAQMMYAYGSGSTSLVLECDLGGQTMYYHVPYEPEWNTHRVFKFTVYQAGADTPLGELPEEAIEVSVTTLNVLDWDADESNVGFQNGTGGSASGSGQPQNDEQHITLTYDIQSSQVYGLFSYADETTVTKVLIDGNPVEVVGYGLDYAFDTLGEHIIDVYISAPEGLVLKRSNSGFFLDDLDIYPTSIDFNGSKILEIDLKGIKNLISLDFSECVFTGDNIVSYVNNCVNLESVDFSDCTFDLPETAVLHFIKFGGCTSLMSVDYSTVQFPSVADYQFYSMFSNCTSLESVDMGTLDMWNATYGDFDRIFANCTSLTSVKWMGRIGNNIYLGDKLFEGVSTTGVFYYEQDRDFNYIIEHLPENWTATPVSL